MVALALEAITSFSVVPLRLITFTGFVVFLGTMLVSLWALWVKLFSAEAVPGWTSVVLPMYFLGRDPDLLHRHAGRVSGQDLCRGEGPAAFPCRESDKVTAKRRGRTHRAGNSRRRFTPWGLMFLARCMTVTHSENVEPVYPDRIQVDLRSSPHNYLFGNSTCNKYFDTNSLRWSGSGLSDASTLSRVWANDTSSKMAGRARRREREPLKATPSGSPSALFSIETGHFAIPARRCRQRFVSWECSARPTWRTLAPCCYSFISSGSMATMPRPSAFRLIQSCFISAAVSWRFATYEYRILKAFHRAFP